MIIAKASLQDSNDIWTWRNDPYTRSMFINTDEVSWDIHRNWFEKSLINPNRFLYIGYIEVKEDEKVGMCRFDIEINSNIADVSINLNPKMRGKHLSHQLLADSITVFWENRRISLKATIKKENTASIRCFSKCGFVLDSADTEYNHYLLKP
jgi:RimJ/RimL family protein N-acetyltransferase